MGLSPLARGSRRAPRFGRCWWGPIPARAGQPSRSSRAGSIRRAYPRSRGAAEDIPATRVRVKGLSPLARGSPHAAVWRAAGEGPIPARAGQPGTKRASCHLRRAYPRSRGAAPSCASVFSSGYGLSPLARGSPAGDGCAGDRPGPIPARAGQPACPAVPLRASRAYPRSRGAAYSSPPPTGACKGLSPLARGSPGRLSNSALESGPIPARAGQPPALSSAAPRWRAYPRSRGAALTASGDRVRVDGLSPLARGSRRCALHGVVFPGPIPARAGQPAQTAARTPWRRAYPRSRGAAHGFERYAFAAPGLSPLARGSRPRHPHRPETTGPIPARAGQPVTRCS